MISNFSTSNKNWDYLIFTQHWPVTVCIKWKEIKPINLCNLNSSLWTIHGIWPTRKGTLGPFFCNKTNHFNLTSLSSIKNEMKINWLNVENNTQPDSLWKHEWEKHGTCAFQVVPLNSELKYFSKGLDWWKDYNIFMILKESGIVPGVKGYVLNDINDSLVKKLKKRPIIECVIDKVSKEFLLSEIRLCFNKSLELVDCNLIKYHNNTADNYVLSNCNPEKPVMYYDKVPVKEAFDNENKWLESVKHYNKLITLYENIHFVMWLTR